MTCPLCQAADAVPYAQFKVHRQMRSFFECSRCSGVFVPSHEHLSSEAEKELYDQHSNCEDDQSYRDWLGPVFFGPASTGQNNRNWFAGRRSRNCLGSSVVFGFQPALSRFM